MARFWMNSWAPDCFFVFANVARGRDAQDTFTRKSGRAGGGAKHFRLVSGEKVSRTRKTNAYSPSRGKLRGLSRRPMASDDKTHTQDVSFGTVWFPCSGFMIAIHQNVTAHQFRATLRRQWRRGGGGGGAKKGNTKRTKAGGVPHGRR